ncbi:heavy metal translocating P-type ATPase [Corynebacterium halotolerans]|uniref:Putative cation-transporting atpase n=1 Tax=Corynebacterium halotolerans YIM 70093 = DSM 44683 TaxID=1121362 RepID=M1NWH7_9CORY|nr:cation-translocating P-type ATPase [Corynebacterium halotolerans]AGF73842.1 putative cation-transporting atpase [Corynebacterium halotolerans YIM 70093 = DSM 44683]
MDACCAPATSPAEKDNEEHTPWWRDRAILIPAVSGLTLLTGLILEWFVPGAGLVATALFWVSLLLGASQFVPGALKSLFIRGKLGIGLLMTISAIGAVLLGFIEEAAALAFLYSIAEALEDRAMDKARSGLRALLALLPSTATIIAAHGATRTVPVEDLVPGDVLRLAAGERLATDGVIRSGHSSLDVSAITGESIPVQVGPDDAVLAGSINTTGALEVEATAAGMDNSLTTVVELVERAQNEKGQRARIADRLARPLVPGVLILAILVAVIGSLLGDPGVWIERALVVLVAASPCALAISVPVTVVSGIGAASKFGVVIKSGAAFERLGGIRHLALDKTGTLTRNQPTVAELLTTDGIVRADVLGWAAALESHSTHPLASAITAATRQAPAAQQVAEAAGQGITGVIDGAQIAVGSPRWLAPGPLATQVEALESQGMTVVIVHRDDRPVGAVGVRDELRPETPTVIKTLTREGFGSTMLTGDNTRTATALAVEAGIQDVRAQLRPEDKAQAVADLAERGPVAMIGDGINDAPALASADIGIAMGATGSDAAIESADVAFTGDDLRLIPRALHHARLGRSIINQNIFLSLAIIIVLLPLAITGVLGLAAVVLVHEVAEVIVIANGLRAARAPHPTPAPDEAVRMPRHEQAENKART